MMFKNQTDSINRLILLTLCCFIPGWTLAAAQQWYEIEIILFKQKSPYLQQEFWPESIKLTYPDKMKDFVTPLLFPDAQEPTNPTDKPANENQTQQQEPGLIKNSLIISDPAALASEDQELFELLDKEGMQLSELYQTLSRSPRYVAMAHLGWRQTLVNKKLATWVRIAGGRDYSASFNHDGSSATLNQTYHQMGLTSDTMNQRLQNNSLDEMSTQQDPATRFEEESAEPDSPSIYDHIVPELDGAIRVYLNRFLHVNTQLYLRVPGKKEVDIGTINADLSSSLLQLTDDGTLDSDFESGFSWRFETDNNLPSFNENKVQIDELIDYLMQQSRRIRSGEIHYFDHPLFGMIIEVRPWENKQQTTEEDHLLTEQNNIQ